MRSETSPERLKLIAAFESCIEDGVYPSSLELNKRRGQANPSKTLNGRLNKVRLELMIKHGIPYRSNYGAYGNKGEVPDFSRGLRY